MQSKRFPSRWVGATILLAFAIAFPLRSANAIVGPHWGLAEIPVERLIRNLKALIENDPKNAQVRFNLARAHSMAYASRTDSVGVRKDREKENDLFGGGADIPFAVTPTDDKDKLKTAREHLAKAIEAYAEGLKLDPDNLTGRLGYAWCLEQSGKKNEAIAGYRRVIAAAWVQDKNLHSLPMYAEPLTVEAAGCLIPLLDKEKDKKEIDELQDRVQKLRKLGRPISPIIVPLKAEMTEQDLEDRSASVRFDADGSGLEKRWTWITKDAGWLVYDPHHSGKITSALQLFGNVTFWMFWNNGYEALAALDDDRDGMLVGKELEGLAIWQDLNHNGTSERGEVKPVAQCGIVAISCRHATDTTHPDRIAYSPRGVFFRDGSNRATYDIILHPAIATVE